MVREVKGNHSSPQKVLVRRTVADQPRRAPPTVERSTIGAKSPKQHKSLALNRNMMMLILSIGSLLVGVFGIYLWFTQMPTNYVVGVVVIILTGSGGIGTRRYWNKRSEISVPVKVEMQTVATGPPHDLASGVDTNNKEANSLNIYPWAIVFQHVIAPAGQLWKCLNLNKDFYVHMWDTEKLALKPFALPDQSYRDPEWFGQRVLELPAHRRLFRHKESMLQKLSPFLLLVVIIISWIVIMTTTGGG